MLAHMAPVTRRHTAALADLEHLRERRDDSPVWRDPETGYWNVYRYQDVALVLSDYRTFSSDFAVVFPDRADMTEGNILVTDPPRHGQLRNLVSQAFTPRAIARLEPRIEQLADELLDQVAGRTHIELVGDLAYPLPVTVIAELLGVPAADRARFKEWADALLSQSNTGPTPDEVALERAQAQIKHFHEYLAEHVAERRIRPREDLLTDLVAADIDGQRLTDGEIVGFATILLLAGHITTTLLLGNALLCLDEFACAQAALRADPHAISAALEEVLRYRSPVGMTARVTARPVQLHEQLIAEKQVVNAWLVSANHDERQFDHPDDFVIDRHPNQHLGFGKGIHFCLGAPLARLESTIALGVLLQRYADLRVDPEWPLEPYANRFNGVRELHLLVKPA
jgi:cytochrome P450